MQTVWGGRNGAAAGPLLRRHRIYEACREERPHLAEKVGEVYHDCRGECEEGTWRWCRRTG